MLAFSSAIASVIALLSVAEGFTRAFSDVYRSHSVDIVVSRQGSADRLSSSVDQAFVAKIEAVDAVDRAGGVLLETMSLEEQEIYGIPTMGIRKGSWLRDDYQWEKGSESIITSDRRLSLGIHLARRLDRSVGDTVSLFEEDYVIDGVFQSPSAWENGSMIMPLSQLQALTDRSGQVTYINVILKPGTSADSAGSVLDEIHELDKRLLAMTTSDFVETDTRMQIAGAMAWMTSVIALVIGAIGTLNTMMTNVVERTHEIGILRAIGWRRGRVTRMIVGECLLMALISILVGSVMAVVLTNLLARVPSVAGFLTPEINVGVFAKGAVLGLAVGLLGAIMPAVRASRMVPVEALRPW